MENEKDTLTSSDDPKSVKTSDKKSDNKKDGKLNTFFKDLRGEFTKIIWVSREELFKQTLTVIMVSIMIGIIIFGMDTCFKIMFDLLVDSFISKG